jgi:hypothetical protein
MLGVRLILSPVSQIATTVVAAVAINTTDRGVTQPYFLVRRNMIECKILPAKNFVHAAMPQS